MKKDALRESERRLASAQRLAHIGSWEFFVADDSVVWSNECYRIFGFEPGEIETNYETIMPLLYSEDVERVEAAVQNTIETGEGYELEYRLLHPSGSITFVIGRGEISERAPDGEVISLSGTIQDITERKASEEALKSREQELTEAQRLAHVGSWEWLVATGEVIWSDECCRIFGVDPEKFKPTFESITAQIPPRDAELIAEATTRAVETGESYEVEHRVNRPDGSERHVLERGEVSIRDESGQPTRVRGSMHDITELKLAALEIEALNRELEERVQSRTTALEKEVAFSEQLIDTAQAIVLILDDEGRIVRFNPYLEEMIGYSLDEVQGKDWIETFVPADQTAEIEGVFEEAIQGRRTRGKISGMKTRDGKVLQIEWYDTLVPDEAGEATNLLAIGQDVTERMQIQAQLIQSSKMANLGEMATGVAHELNQPLNVIRLATENIGRRVDKGEADKSYLLDKLAKIDAQVTRASRIIDNMRIFGRKPDAEPSLLDLGEVVTRATTFFSERLRLDGVDLKIEVPEEPVQVSGQLVQVEQVILNLVNNARDAILESESSKTKEIAITLSTDSEAGLAAIAVRDSGSGINPEYLDRVFEPFFTTKEIGKGTGLGLSISYGIITDMGGEIEALNHEKGAEFVVRLPLDKA